MNIYLAPLEGITGYIYRSTQHKHYGGADRYYTPFIGNPGLNHKEIEDVKPENNQGMNVVPQIIGNRVEEFIVIAKQMQDRGYTEVNLNLGCPSGTVVSKHRGAGMLGYLDDMNRFLDDIYNSCPLPISIKTRVGLAHDEDWANILEIYNQYPVAELIIHPRIQKDLYRQPIRMDTWRLAQEISKAPVCYNGEIHTRYQFERLVQQEQIPALMLGRGGIKNQNLMNEIRGGQKGT